MSTVQPTVAKVRTQARKLDRINAGTAKTIDAMRRGASLHLEFTPTGPRWMLSNGIRVDREIAERVTRSSAIVGVGDALFEGIAAQTWRYAA